jgi:hypothetical protein
MPNTTITARLVITNKTMRFMVSLSEQPDFGGPLAGMLGRWCAISSLAHARAHEVYGLSATALGGRNTLVSP